MDDVARFSATDRRDLFLAVAAARGVRANLIEKDFWVSWILGKLFSLTEFPAGLIFKGGTSLSKVYKLIERFSEDVDLSFDRSALGFGTTEDLAKLSGKKRRATLDALAASCQQLIRDRLIPDLTAVLTASLGESKAAGWSLEIDPDDPQAVRFHYPPSLEQTADGSPPYMRPFVLLELGGRADHWPAENGVVTSMAAEQLPALFKDPSRSVRVLSAERTFWEKATLLHRWHHRSDKVMGERQSRHYYDVAQLSRSPIGRAATANTELLLAVARYKTVFYEEPGARYELAKPGSLRLMPHLNHQATLEADYEGMAEMLFGEPPSFSSILQKLEELEQRINQPTDV